MPAVQNPVPEVLPDSSDTEPGDMPGKLTSVNSTSPLAPPPPPPPPINAGTIWTTDNYHQVWTNDQEANTLFRHQCLNEEEDCELTYSIYQYMYRIVVVCD